MTELIQQYRETIRSLERRVYAIRETQKTFKPGSGHYERCSFRASLLEQEIMDMYHAVREMEDRETGSPEITGPPDRTVITMAQCRTFSPAKV